MQGANWGSTKLPKQDDRKNDHFQKDENIDCFGGN